MTRTPSSSVTGTASSSETGTPSQSVTSTPSNSVTRTGSSSVTRTASSSVTGTPSTSITRTPSSSVTRTSSSSVTRTPSPSGTSSQARTRTPSNTPPPTISESPTQTPTSSATISPGASPSLTATATPTGSQTPAVVPDAALLVKIALPGAVVTVVAANDFLCQALRCGLACSVGVRLSRVYVNSTLDRTGTLTYLTGDPCNFNNTGCYCEDGSAAAVRRILEGAGGRRRMSGDIRGSGNNAAESDAQSFSALPLGDDVTGALSTAHSRALAHTARQRYLTGPSGTINGGGGFYWPSSGLQEVWQLSQLGPGRGLWYLPQAGAEFLAAKAAAAATAGSGSFGGTSSGGTSGSGGTIDSSGSAGGSAGVVNPIVTLNNSSSSAGNVPSSGTGSDSVVVSTTFSLDSSGSQRLSYNDIEGGRERRRKRVVELYAEARRQRGAGGGGGGGRSLSSSWDDSYSFDVEEEGAADAYAYSGLAQADLAAGWLARQRAAEDFLLTLDWRRALAPAGACDPEGPPEVYDACKQAALGCDPYGDPIAYAACVEGAFQCDPEGDPDVYLACKKAAAAATCDPSLLDTDPDAYELCKSGASVGIIVPADPHLKDIHAIIEDQQEKSAELEQAIDEVTQAVDDGSSGDSGSIFGRLLAVTSTGNSTNSTRRAYRYRKTVLLESLAASGFIPAAAVEAQLNERLLYATIDVLPSFNFVPLEPTASVSPSFSPTPSGSASGTVTASGTRSATATPTTSGSATGTRSGTASGTGSRSGSGTRTASATATRTVTPSAVSTASSSRTPAAAASFSSTRSAIPTRTKGKGGGGGGEGGGGEEEGGGPSETTRRPPGLFSRTRTRTRTKLRVRGQGNGNGNNAGGPWSGGNDWDGAIRGFSRDGNFLSGKGQQG